MLLSRSLVARERSTSSLLRSWAAISSQPSFVPVSKRLLTIFRLIISISCRYESLSSPISLDPLVQLWHQALRLPSCVEGAYWWRQTSCYWCLQLWCPTDDWGSRNWHSHRLQPASLQPPHSLHWGRCMSPSSSRSSRFLPSVTLITWVLLLILLWLRVFWLESTPAPSSVLLVSPDPGNGSRIPSSSRFFNAKSSSMSRHGSEGNEPLLWDVSFILVEGAE